MLANVLREMSLLRLRGLVLEVLSQLRIGSPEIPLLRLGF
jgi:hypothetical protein